ncbi:LysR family transcriptional regulator [Amycolatopsis magusensis]|uniref:DNA-binding transcriptional LysR family regulator n=1 Tax=Amycolatopsis magusensis TaxID=882444 RepID=A0ABS4PQW8_9PSEU|nr:LysR family transcriptional regulator [Amycolatopsis magusensis]MBP2181817.1 DNA-binding transcriptional LysR family regulator [Amycolatopsis magusensis]
MDLRTLRYFVTVAEERHFGRAAARLHMTQPPLSRAIRGLEADLGVDLFERTAQGVSPTAAGVELLAEAKVLLEHADQVRDRVAAAAESTLVIGTLADSAEQLGPRLVAAFRARHPKVTVRVREADFSDPTCGLRSGLADVALTRAPFDDTGISTHTLRADPVSVLVRADDPLATRETLWLRDLDDRPWFRLADVTDPVWAAYWSGGKDREGPKVRTAQECFQAVRWNSTIGLMPGGSPLPDGLVAVPLADQPPCELVIAWPSAKPNSLVRSFVRIAVETGP